jgi:carboxylate-amine ligase
VRIPFAASERASLGIEWELELVDTETRELRSAATEVLAQICPPDAAEHPKAKHELLECTV